MLASNTVIVDADDHRVLVPADVLGGQSIPTAVVDAFASVPVVLLGYRELPEQTPITADGVPLASTHALIPDGVGGRVMVSRVLVPMDGSEMSDRALEYALEVFPDAAITVLHVVGEPSAMWGHATGLALADNLEEAAMERSEAVFDRAREIAADADADPEFETETELGHPVRAILNEADDYETIVIGTHGGSVADRIFVGNVAEKIVRRSPVPVVVVR